ncbi:MAG: type II toxin-antitoxin system VapB family antitoxin [Pseudomonadota bacterium]
MRTTIDIDQTVVDSLREEIGTRTKRETIDYALRFLLERVQDGDAALKIESRSRHLVCLPDPAGDALQRAMELPQTAGDHSARLTPTQ